MICGRSTQIVLFDEAMSVQYSSWNVGGSSDPLKSSLRQQADAGKDVIEGIPVQHDSVVVTSIQLLRDLIDQVEVLLTEVLVEPMNQGDLSVLQLDRRDAPLSDAATGVEQAGNEQLRVIDAAAALQLAFALVDLLQLRLVALDIIRKPPLLPGAGCRVPPAQLFDPEAQRIDLGQGFEQGPVGVTDEGGDSIGVGEGIDPPFCLVLTERAAGYGVVLDSKGPRQVTQGQTHQHAEAGLEAGSLVAVEEKQHVPLVAELESVDEDFRKRILFVQG